MNCEDCDYTDIADWEPTYLQRRITMADIELVIKIPEELAYEGFERHFTEEEKNILIKAIGNGTPLPKGHGILIDADEYVKNHEILGWLDTISVNGFYEVVHTIIKADKTESEE